MPAERILILGGTGEARALATKLLAAGFDPVTSLGGITQDPLLPAGRVRRGGFGGEDGLRAYVEAHAIRAVVDASHPFAARIARHAAQAAAAAGIPCCRLERPPWQPEAGDHWIGVAGIAEAVAALPRGARPFVTVGRKEIAAFLARADVVGLARMIEPPAAVIPANWTLLLARPPFTIESENRLLAAHGITHLVSKNAGGSGTRAKLVAARERNIPVVMLQRPARPEVPVFATCDALLAALGELLSP